MIEIRDLTKCYGSTTAVDGLGFTVKPGSVTGFLGPNGAGKSTTMRILLGLTRADSGQALVDGRGYSELVNPLTVVGSHLDTESFHPGRSAMRHLRALALANGIDTERVTAVLEQVGLAGVANRRVGGFSLGMRQRLGIAGALLGDPPVLLFDEPVNGLDPDGVRWIRNLLRDLAGRGRTVLVSSHLMSEMEQTADRLIVIGRGRLIADTTVSELAGRFSSGVRVRSPRAGELAMALRDAGGTVTDRPDGTLRVAGLSVERVGDLAAGAGLPLHEVAESRSSLEDAYLSLTNDSVEHRAEGIATA